MSLISSRLYQDSADLQSIIEFTFKVRPAEYLYDYPAKADLEENLASTEIQANIRLWFDGSHLRVHAA